jgi:hypothetical protein
VAVCALVCCCVACLLVDGCHVATCSAGRWLWSERG